MKLNNINDNKKRGELIMNYIQHAAHDDDDDVLTTTTTIPAAIRNWRRKLWQSIICSCVLSLAITRITRKRINFLGGPRQLVESSFNYRSIILATNLTIGEPFVAHLRPRLAHLVSELAIQLTSSAPFAATAQHCLLSSAPSAVNKTTLTPATWL